MERVEVLEMPLRTVAGIGRGRQGWAGVGEGAAEGLWPYISSNQKQCIRDPN